MRRRIAVYGSLREGEYNFDRVMQNFGKNSIKVLSNDVEISGYNLYNLGPYPAITEGENNLTIDVISVDENAYQFIRNMELGAGYRESTVKVPKYGDIHIYVYPKGSFNEFRLIEHGNWSKFLQEN